MDHAWLGGPPLLFETMAFWPGRKGYEQQRCSTWLQAQDQHARICAEVARPRAVLAYCRCYITDFCNHAKWDLQDRWRELRGVELPEIEKTMRDIENRIRDREGW
jgi:hypothetical protein